MAPERQRSGPDAFGMSINFAVAVVFFGALGWFADGWLDTLPVFTVAGTLLGGVLGFLNVYWKVRKGDREKRG